MNVGAATSGMSAATVDLRDQLTAFRQVDLGHRPDGRGAVCKEQTQAKEGAGIGR